MIELLTALLAAHLVGDFVLQPNWVIARKKNAAVIVLHVALVTLLSAALTGVLAWPLIAIVFVSHLVMDAIKVHVLKNTLWAFLIDQGVHLAVIIGLAIAYDGAFAAGVWPQLLGDHTPLMLAGLALVAGFVACVRAGGFLIDLAIRQYADQLDPDSLGGLKGGGMVIGWLERALVFLLLLAGELTAIGFLIAAKSILRFGDIRSADERKITEYVIIGTFMSFGWALLVSFATRAAVAYFLLSAS